MLGPENDHVEAQHNIKKYIVKIFLASMSFFSQLCDLTQAIKREFILLVSRWYASLYKAFLRMVVLINC